MAPRVKANVRPALLVWARTTAGFSESTAAQRLGVEPEVLARWENETDEAAPSIPQLRKLADLYKRPLAAFFLAEPPIQFQIIRDFRRLPESGPQRPYSPDLFLEIRRAAERRALAIELLADLEEQPSGFALEANIGEDTEVVGQRIRAALRVTAELQDRWADPDGRTSFNSWRQRIEEAGSLVFQMTAVESSEASGFAIADRPLPVIVVNQKDTVTRRTYSLLHELAHLMLRLSGVSEIDAEIPRSGGGGRQAEGFCNQTAAAALMPRTDLLDDRRVSAKPNKSDKWTDEEIRDLSRRFGVSRVALVRRLLTVGKTTVAFYDSKRAQYDAEFRAQRAKQREVPATQVKRNMPQEAISNLGKPLVGLILGNYNVDNISLSAAAGYLGIKAQHIPKLEAKVSGR